MCSLYNKAKTALEYISKSIIKELGFMPEIETALILGTCFGNSVKFSDQKVVIPYSLIPNFTKSTVNGHSGNLICTQIGNKWCFVMQGRTHYYEGYDMEDVTLPVRVFALCGVKVLVVTNAAGGINKSYKIGDFVVLKDHLSFFMPSPLRGENEDKMGLRFPSMDNAYDEKLQQIAFDCGKKSEINLHSGVYAYMKGPQFETHAEIRALSFLGADVVGMSTVPEVIVARHCGIRVAGFSCVTNMAAGVTDKAVSHEDVSETENLVKEDFAPFMEKFIESI